MAVSCAGYVLNFARTDQFQVGLTLHGTVEDPAFVRFVEKVSRETNAVFHTHDWLLLAMAARGDRFPKGAESRATWFPGCERDDSK